MLEGDNLIVGIGGPTGIGQPNRREGSSCPAFFLHACLEQGSRFRGIARGPSDSIGTQQVGVIAGHALGHDVVRGNDRAFPDVSGNERLVDRQLEGLADLDIVKGFDQVVHGVVDNHQLGHLVELPVGEGLGYALVGSRHT